ncbi:DUF2634 domain-containing protein [Paenibacillus sanguinis]|uniref:DUF2634 domain-containing protein n=1 Tax=Paenibacillus sanguinis TaxID=225906 RepID=UPI00035DD71C|nr:DUF2634 domain-containing protein [Paenibacillus sanguinis]
MLTPESAASIPSLFASEIQPSRTYRLDRDAGRVSGMVDGLEAVKQFIIKTLGTGRWRHVIYPDSYGSEADNIIGQSFSLSFTRTELARIITEALIYDERINEVKDFDIRQEQDRLTVFFTVVTVYGNLFLNEVI